MSLSFLGYQNFHDIPRSASFSTHHHTILSAAQLEAAIMTSAHLNRTSEQANAM
jgi:hypothetical protein